MLLEKTLFYTDEDGNIIYSYVTFSRKLLQAPRNQRPKDEPPKLSSEIEIDV
jgi:hypothetical protein